jgi:hypothetical protein
MLPRVCRQWRKYGREMDALRSRFNSFASWSFDKHSAVFGCSPNNDGICWIPSNLFSLSPSLVVSNEHIIWIYVKVIRRRKPKKKDYHLQSSYFYSFTYHRCIAWQWCYQSVLTIFTFSWDFYNGMSNKMLFIEYLFNNECDGGRIMVTIIALRLFFLCTMFNQTCNRPLKLKCIF